jgi:hypothetical protein
VPADDATGRDLGDVGAEVRFGGQSGRFNHVQADAAVLFDFTLIKLEPVHA